MTKLTLCDTMSPKVLHLEKQGVALQDIAFRLGISMRTVSRILRDAKVYRMNRTEARGER